MKPLKRPYSILSLGAWLGLMLAAVIVTQPALAQTSDQSPAGQSPSAQQAAQSDVIAQLKALTDMAPARQMSQPGAQAITDWIENRFETAVSTHNSPDVNQTLTAAIRQVDDKVAQLNDVRNDMAQPSEAVQDAISPVYISLTLERPMPATIICALVMVMAFAAYLIQRRKGVLVLGLVSLGLVIGLPLAGWLVVTPYEKQLREVRGVTDEGSRAQVVSRELYELQVQAAKALQGKWQHGQITFPAAVYEPGTAHLEGPAGRVRLYQLAPNLVDPGNLPGMKLQGRMKYVGRGESEVLTEIDVRDAIVLMEFDSYKRWIDIVQLGARALVFIEPSNQEAINYTQAVAKTTLAPLSLPRFYVKRADLAASISEDWASALSGQGMDVTLSQETPGRWKSQDAAIQWLFIPAAGSDENQDNPLSNQLVHIQAYKDAQSIVPELSPAATQAANLVALDQLLSRFERAPPARPVLLTAITGHTLALQGEAEFGHFAFGDASAIFDEIAQDQMDLAKQVYLQNLHDVDQRPLDESQIEYMRYASPVVAGQVLKANKTVLDVLRSMRNRVREARNLATLTWDQTYPPDASDPPAAELKVHEEKLREYDQRMGVLVKYMGLFNRFGTRFDFSDLSEEELAELSDIFRDISQQARLRAGQIRRSIERNYANMAIRRRLMMLANPQAASLDTSSATERELFLRSHEALPASLIVSLDLSFDSDHVGFFAYDAVNVTDRGATVALQRMSRMSRFTLELADRYAASQGKPNLLMDTIRNVGGVPWHAYLGQPMALGSRMYHTLNLPAMTLATTHDMRTRIYTPSDTFDRINKANYQRVMDFVVGYLPQLVNAPKLDDSRRLIGKSATLSVQLNLRQRDEFSVSVPQTPVTESLLVLWRAFTQPMMGDVQSYPILMSDHRGVAVVRSAGMRDFHLSAYKYNSDYSRLVAALDMGEGSKRFTALIKPGAGEMFVSRTFVAFPASKVDLVGLTEPLMLSPVMSMEVLDAVQDALPRSFGAVGVLPVSSVAAVPVNLDGIASVFLDPLAAFKLRAGQGLVINTTQEEPTGMGFGAQTGLIRDSVMTSATDMWRLTENRLELLQSKGVSNDTATDFNTDANNYLDKAQQSLTADDSPQALVEAESARGLAFRAYTRGLSTINDLIKAVVIFLAMVIPFCFFLTKLISPFTDINRQLMLFAGVFVGMAVLLWLVHPAFKIASTPAVVILAFIIMGLAIFVAVILMSRFNSSMNQAVEEALGSETAEAPQGRLMGVAFLVGINNMKRRRIRTTLTCVTIVLVTFTMLSVISVGQDVEPSRMRVGTQSPYSGLLFTNPGLSPITPTQMRRLRSHFPDSSVMASRIWVQRKGTYGDYLSYLIKPSQAMDGAAVEAAEAKVIMGMEVSEDGLTGTMPIASGGRWFSSNDAAEIILSVQAAQLLGITPENLQGQTMIVNGQELTLVGLINDERFSQMHDLGDLPLVPLLSAATQEVAAQVDAAQASGAEALDAAGDLTSAPGIEPARPMDIAIVPLNIARNMPNAEFYTLSIKYTTPEGASNPAIASEKTMAAARHFIRYQHARLYTGLEQPVTLESTGRTLEAGQYALTSSSSTQVGGILKVAIPIILAATIILNTMLGSVMERRREVAIYNAIGLNPGHVMAFFLAESLVFGMIGAVAGYLIGQILSMAITYFNIVSLNLNYSSLSVMVVIFLTIATVMLSTVYPAMMAARAAVPSGQRRWALPQPDGNQIFVQFPFSYDATRVKGVCAYLREFMYQNSEASTGSFLAKLGPVGTVPTHPDAVKEDGEAGEAAEATNYAMIFDIAPAPFDLGVNQKMEVYAYYDPHVKAHMLAVYLTRTSGEMSNWKTVNQPFLETLRKRLLGWRSQRPETQQGYYRQGEQLFAQAKPLPVADHQTARADEGDR